MQVILDILSGALAGTSIRVSSGQFVRFGRTSKADRALPDDVSMSSVHFGVECGESMGLIRDLNSRNGTLLNGARVGSAVLTDGDEIVAGHTRFRVRFEQDKPAADVPARKPDEAAAKKSLLAILQEDFQPLYALLDAARGPDVYREMILLKAEHKSLFQGQHGRNLTLFAPYLVRLPPRSRLLKKLVSQAWGKNWGVFLSCPNPMHEVRKHFRQFLLANLPDGKQVYFRFYDPRVLRVYLPTCTPEELYGFFGPVWRFAMEAEKPEDMLEFVRGRTGMNSNIWHLAAKGGPAGASAPDATQRVGTVR